MLSVSDVSGIFLKISTVIDVEDHSFSSKYNVIFLNVFLLILYLKAIHIKLNRKIKLNNKFLNKIERGILLMPTYSIHTIQLGTILSCNSFRKFEKRIELGGKYEKQESYDLWKYPYYRNGITRFEVRHLKKRIKTYPKGTYLSIIITPAYAIYPEAGARLLKPEEMHKALEIVMEELKRLLPEDVFQRLKVSRVDLVGDLQMKTQVQAEEYIKLLQKGRQIRSLQEKPIYNYVVKQWITYDESWYLGCRSYDLQVYSKYQQMMQRKMKNAEEAIGVVRVELRCKRDKIKTIAKKYGIDKKLPIIDTLVCIAFAAPEIEVSTMIQDSVGEGDFYTLAKMKEIIEMSRYQERIKGKMVDFAEQLSRCQSIQEMIDRGLLYADDWRFLLQKFNNINVSPIPIPARFQYKTASGVFAWGEDC